MKSRAANAGHRRNQDEQVPPQASARPPAVVARQPCCACGSAILPEDAWQQVALSLRLSGRELQIVRAVFDDRTEHAIAADLGVARRTVHTHCERLHRKLAVTDRLQLVLRIMGEFLLLTASPNSPLPPLCARQMNGRCPMLG
ncbi:MAG: LuxR C-terminal-related transcriptional regulator [Verrucomicrobiia bacterium]